RVPLQPLALLVEVQERVAADLVVPVEDRVRGLGDGLEGALRRQRNRLVTGHGHDFLRGAYAWRRLAPQPCSVGSSVRRPRGPAPAARGQRELVLHTEPHDHGVARPREAEARADDELEATGEPAVEGREDVVLLRAGRVEAADLSGVAEEFDTGHEVAGE